jgi:hypothetical protein
VGLTTNGGFETTKVEQLPLDRCEQVSFARVDLDTRECGSEPREGDGAWVAVRGQDGGRVVLGQKRLDAAAGAEVEGPLDPSPWRCRGEGEAGGTDTEDLVRMYAGGSATGVVRHGDLDAAVLDGLQADRRRPVGTQPRRRHTGSVRGVGRDRHADHEQPGKGRQRTAVARTPQHGRELVAVEVRPSRRTEQLVDGLDRPARSAERSPDPRCVSEQRSRIGQRRRHAPTLAASD